MPSTMFLLEADTVSAAKKTPFEHPDVSGQFWVIDISKDSPTRDEANYTICYKAGSYEHTRTYNISGNSCPEPRVIQRILGRNLSASNQEFEGFLSHIECTESYSSQLLDQIVKLWAGNSDEDCCSRLFPAGVKGICSHGHR